jgi:hypothetical protein
MDVVWDVQYFPQRAPDLKGDIMEKIIGKFAWVALAVLTIGVFADRAQIANQLEFKMAQPFTVGNTTLTAGSYIVRPVQGTDQMVIEITSASGKPSVMVDVNSAAPDGSQIGSHLVFNKYKNVLALSEIFPGGGNTGYQLVQGHPEQLAAKSETPTKQTIASTSK